MINLLFIVAKLCFFYKHFLFRNNPNIDTSITHITSENSNIFEDLGFNPREATKLKIKAQLMCQISEWIKEKQLQQKEASDLLHVTQPRLSDVMKGKSDRFTIDALIDMLERTGKHVTVQFS